MILALAFIQNSGSQTTVQYDPWADINDDGKIDMKDIIYEIRLFGTTGDPTKNVNVTNWLSPRPKILLYGVFNVSWWSGISSVSRIYTPQYYLYVGDYTRMSILLKFDNITVEYGEAFWTVSVCWADIDENIVYRPGQGLSEEVLSSTLLVVYPNGFSRQVSLDSYVIKSRYITLWPELMDFDSEHKGTAICSIYVYLTYGTTIDSTSKTMRLFAGKTSTNENEIFGGYTIAGFRQITIYVYTNVSCYVTIQDQTNTPIDSFSKGCGWIRKTYDIFVPKVWIVLSSPSTKPWWIDVELFLTT
jgi:hypothetical protein